MISEDSLVSMLWVILGSLAVWGWILMIRGENVFSRRRKH